MNDDHDTGTGGPPQALTGAIEKNTAPSGQATAELPIYLSATYQDAEVHLCRDGRAGVQGRGKAPIGQPDSPAYRSAQKRR